MQESIGTRKNLDKGPKVHDFAHRPHIDLPNLSLLGQLAHHTYCCLCCSFVWRGNHHHAVIFDINGDTGSVDDTTNSFPARPYHLTHLILMNFEPHDTWGICRCLLTWCPQDGFHGL